MADLTVNINGAPTPVYLGDSTALAALLAAQARAAATDAETAADVVINTPDSPFMAGATDAVARAAIKAVTIGDADETDSYFLNYEFSLFPGLFYRIKLRLHSVKWGTEVARWDFQQVDNPDGSIEPTVTLSARVDSFEVITDRGITATVTVDWAAVTWSGSGAVTTYTNMASTGLRPGLVVPAAETRRNRLAPATPISRLIRVGTGQDFPTLTGSGGAMEFIERGDFATPITRSTYPSSHICTPERPLEVRVSQTGYSETIGAFTSGGIDQSNLRIPHGLVLHLPYRDTLILMDTPAKTAPVIEMNFTGTIYGQGKIEQRGPGYVVHIDNNGGVIEDFVRDLQSVLRGVTLSKTFDDTVPLVGLGIGSGQDVLFDGVRFERPTNTAGGPHIAGHNSPNEIRGGLINIRNCTSLLPGAGKFLSMGKTDASTARHGIIVENSEVAAVEVYNSVGGAKGYVRMSPMTGITITGDMEP